VHVRSVSRSEDGAARVEYRVIAETLFYCGGATVRRDRKRTFFSLTRVPLGEDAQSPVIVAEMGSSAAFLRVPRRNAALEVLAGGFAAIGHDGWSQLIIPEVGDGSLSMEDGSATKELLPEDPGAP